MAHAGTKGQTSFLFSSRDAAAVCKEYSTSPKRGDEALSSDDIFIRIFDLQKRFYAVFLPEGKAKIVMGFWRDAGVGISSRLAEQTLRHVDLLKESSEDVPPSKLQASPANQHIRERIAGLLERAPVGPARRVKVSSSDVYLYPTGMGAIYSVHKTLLSLREGSTILFGFAFHSTLPILQEFGPCTTFFGFGDSSELDKLETLLSNIAIEGKPPVQAVWTEFPANPLLVTPDLTRLRRLADKHRFALIVDETVASFCNVDVLPAADIVVTSLTKSFSGYADVMGASAVLNPSSPLYSELQPLFSTTYQPDEDDLFAGDAEVLLHNSNDYLSRSAILNANAACLGDFLAPLASDPNSGVKAVYYPTTSPSSTLRNYKAYLRPPTSDFPSPGYGCLFSLDFESEVDTVAFYDNLNVHHGPHLGAHLTLALPYVKGIYGRANQLNWAAQYGLRETMIWVSVGLEDGEELLETFKVAVRAMDSKRRAEREGGEEQVVVSIS